MNEKPLGIKNYGSIPHLPGSRMGAGDHKCHIGQARICLEQVRDKHDLVIVQEKLDGSNVGVAKINGRIIPITRSGYTACSSKYEQHHKFAKWVMRNWGKFYSFLKDGERIVGEWLVQAHGTRYDLIDKDPFVVFDIMKGLDRLCYNEIRTRTNGIFVTAYTVHVGESLGISDAMNMLGEFGKHGAIDCIEGAVWRVERCGKVDFLAKYVRPDKEDGCYLPEISGNGAVWNTFKEKE